MTPAASPLRPALQPPEAATQQAWRQLERRLRLLHGFGLLVYSVTTPALAEALKARLSEHLRRQGRRLIVIGSSHPERFAELSLKALFGVPQPADAGACWLEVHRGAGLAPWDAERRELLLRLNERRSILEAERHVPLILLLPAGGAAEMAHLAPDLWHVRLQSVELAAMEQAVRSDGVDWSVAQTFWVPTLETEAEVEAALSYWLDQWRVNFNGFSAHELQFDHPQIWSLSLWDGRRAADVCLQHGRLEQARMVAEDVLTLARLRVHADGRLPLTQRLRDVSVALDMLGRVVEISGDLRGAEKAYLESLEISRELVKKQRAGPQVLRDVSVSLDNVGRVAAAQGAWGVAEAAYKESLQIRRELAEQQVGMPDVLRDVSVALDNVGQVALVRGDVHEAQEAYQESLAMRRKLVATLGKTTQTLRDLSVSLSHVGEIAQTQGDWQGANAACQEGLQLSRELMERLGATPLALRDLFVSLNHAGVVAQSQGDWHGAEMRYREGLDISRQLVGKLGGHPQALRDLLVALNNVGEAAQALGDSLAAEDAYRQSLAISQQLVEKTAESPEALDDQAYALMRLATLRQPVDAERLSEAATIYASLARQCPQVAAYADQLALIQDLLDTRKNALPDPCPDDSK
jgi:tetratricopeptide (TPR) repeat protein